MVELPAPWRVLHALPSVIYEILRRVVSEYHAVIFGPPHVVTGEGSPLFEFLAIRKDEFDVVPVAVFGLLEDLKKVLELPGGGEVAIVVDVYDGELRVFFVIGI